MVRSVDVAIVGGGPAGLVLALLLARSGRDVVLVEQNATFAREYRGEGIAPGTRRIFADLGLSEQIEALDHGAPAAVLARIDGRESRIDFARLIGDDPVGRPIFVPQPLLLEILARAASQASSTIAMGTAFKALRTSGDRVTGIDVVDHDGTASAIEAQLVVACDGRFSAVRRAAGVETLPVKIAYDVLWFSADAPTQTNDLVYVQADGAHVAIAFPSRERRLQVGWLIAKDVPEPARAELLARAPREAGEGLASELSVAGRVMRLPVVSETVATWSKRGLLFIGDAAHPMSPVAAQGLNVAVQDAVVAARHIVPALGDAARLDRALAAIERERAPSIRRIARQQKALPATLRSLGPGRALRLASAGAAAFHRFGLFSLVGRPLLDRFLWGDPPIRADDGPWATDAEDSRTANR